VNSSHASTPPATRPQEPRTTAILTQRALFEAALPHVRRSLRRLGVPAADRDDLAQEILIAAYTKRHEYHTGRGALREWVSGFVMNFTRAYRRTQTKSPGQIVELTPALADTRKGVEEQTMTSQLRRLLHEELFPQVESELLTVVIAHDLDDIKFEAIAAQHQISVSTAHDRYRHGIEQLQRAYTRHQRRQKAQGLMVLPVPLAQLLAADRVIPEVSAEAMDRAIERVERAIRWRDRRAALEALFRHPALCQVGTFFGGPVLFAALALALRPSPRPAPVALVQSTFTAPAPVVAVPLAPASTPPSAVAALPVLPTDRAAPPVNRARSRKRGEEQHAFLVAHQAFTRGSFDVALAALEAQEHRYPTGELATERAALRAQIARLGHAATR